MSIDKLNMTFADYQGPVLDANTMNKITSKIDETVDGVNNCDGGGGTGGGSGNEVVIGDESQITEDTKIFIDPDEVLPQGNDVVDSLEGNETDKAPSVRVVKEEMSIIIESGSNDNGNYIKFSDGTMICRFKQQFSTSISRSWGSLYICDMLTFHDYPVSFIEPPDCSIDQVGGASCMILNASAGTATAPPQIQLASGISLGNFNFIMSVIAIGKWK